MILGQLAGQYCRTARSAGLASTSCLLLPLEKILAKVSFHKRGKVAD